MTSMTDEQRKTLRLLLTGLASGDSLGSSAEFVPQSQIPALYAKLKAKGWPFRQVGGGAFNWKPGSPTDDTDQAMCLVRSYVELGRFDPADVAKRLVAWLDSGPPDVGGTTARTLGRARPQLAGRVLRGLDVVRRGRGRPARRRVAGRGPRRDAGGRRGAERRGVGPVRVQPV